MTENLEGMFQSIPFDEAYRTTIEHDKQLRDFKAQGAVLNGDKKLDQNYTAFAKQAAEYQMQFSQDELYALLGKALEENKQTE